MIKTCKILGKTLLVWLLFALLLTACGGGSLPTGLDSVSRTGHWMSVLEPVEGGSRQVTVIDMNSYNPQLTLSDALVYFPPVTTFSPSGKYLIYRGSEMWHLVDISSQQMWDVAPIQMNVEFLRDDELFITNEQKGESPQSKSVYQVWRARPNAPEQAKWITIADQGRYIFTNQAQGLADVSSSYLSSNINTPAQAFCPPALFLDRDTRVIVGQDGTGEVVVSSAQGTKTDSLQKLSTATTDLLKTYETLQEALALKQMQESPGYEEMTEIEKAAYIDTIARSGITGLASPDGQHLLILTGTSIGADSYRYFLNLINLETDTRIVLSSESDWTPAFLFSPDGSQIIYQSNAQGDRAWYLSNADGSNSMRLSLPDAQTLCWH